MVNMVSVAVMPMVRVCVTVRVRVRVCKIHLLASALTEDLVCKIPLLARRTRPMQPVGQARRATIGYLVYNRRSRGVDILDQVCALGQARAKTGYLVVCKIPLYRPSAARDDKVSCIYIQGILYTI